MRRSSVAVVVMVLLVLAPLAAPAPSAATPGVSPTGGAVPPVPGAVLRLFDPPSTPYGAGHRGVDLAAGPGAPVRAALAGRVAFSGQVAGRGWVTVDHGGGLATTYGWLDPRAVTPGDQVRTGQLLGQLAGDAAHLDWGARLHGAYIDPLALLGPWRARLVPVGDGRGYWSRAVPASSSPVWFAPPVERRVSRGTSTIGMDH